MSKRRLYSPRKGVAKALTRGARAAGAAALVGFSNEILGALEGLTVEQIVGLWLPAAGAFVVVELMNNYRKNRTR